MNQNERDIQRKQRILKHAEELGSVNSALEALRLAELTDGYSEENARIMLSQWIIEAALVRMTGTTLTAEQQNMIKIVTLPTCKNKSKK